MVRDGKERAVAATERDRLAELRDAAAEARDERAEDRDRDADDEDEQRGRPGRTREPDRRGAESDRLAAAGDREASAGDRVAAARDREQAAGQIQVLMHDHLTGFYQRGAGLKELEREVVKSQRTGEPFTIAFIDIDGLKVVNDAQGHDAGDRVILQVAPAIRSVVREYDVVLRYGGDEFVCGLQGLEQAKARKRFEEFLERLAEDGGACASVGVAQLVPGESLSQLISRADAAMYGMKGRD